MAINKPVITDNGVVRPTHVEVNLARLSQNYRAIQRAVAPAAVMPILKANAYGHGLVEAGTWYPLQMYVPPGAQVVDWLP